MTKPKELKVGDRVEMESPDESGHLHDPPKGTIGTVVFYQSDDMIHVDWEDWTKGFDINNTGKEGSSWWVEREQLRKLPDRKEG